MAYYSLWVSLFILVSAQIVERMKSAPLGRPHTGQMLSAVPFMCTWCCRKLKELSLLFSTTAWQFKIKNRSSTSQVIIIIRVEDPVSDNRYRTLLYCIRVHSLTSQLKYRNSHHYHYIDTTLTGPG